MAKISHENMVCTIPEFVPGDTVVALHETVSINASRGLNWGVVCNVGTYHVVELLMYGEEFGWTAMMKSGQVYPARDFVCDAGCRRHSETPPFKVDDVVVVSDDGDSVCRAEYVSKAGKAGLSLGKRYVVTRCAVSLHKLKPTDEYLVSVRPDGGTPSDDTEAAKLAEVQSYAMHPADWFVLAPAVQDVDMVAALAEVPDVAGRRYYVEDVRFDTETGELVVTYGKF